jgi:hypothetical protein
VKKIAAPAWYVPAMIVLGLIAIGGLWFGWNASSKLDTRQQALTSQIKSSEQAVQQDVSSLKGRLAQSEKANANLQGDLTVTTKKLKITQGELKTAREDATKLNDATTQKLSALDTSVHSELATKATTDDVKSVDTKVGGVQTDLNSTKEDLKMAQSEMGTLIARNHDEIEALRHTHFPWPPPRWTSRTKLPYGLVIKSPADTLGNVFGRIEEALHHGRIAQWSVFALGDDGFVVICQMETIDDRGVARPEPQRWSTGPVPPTAWGSFPWVYLQMLFLAPPGRYRVIGLIVTPVLFGDDSERETTAAELGTLLTTGVTDLPPRMKDQTVTSGTRCEAIVYEFRKKRQSDDPAFEGKVTIDPVRHLVGARLWELAQLQ